MWVVLLYKLQTPPPTPPRKGRVQRGVPTESLAADKAAATPLPCRGGVGGGVSNYPHEILENQKIICNYWMSFFLILRNSFLPEHLFETNARNARNCSTNEHNIMPITDKLCVLR